MTIPAWRTPALRTCLRVIQLATSHRAGHKLDALTTVSWVNSPLETISPTLKEGFLVLAIV